MSHPTIMKSNNHPEYDEEISLQNNSVKLNKVESLFDHSNIKEVDASTIMNDNKGEGTYDRLEVSIR